MFERIEPCEPSAIIYKDDVSILMLANSWVGQNFESIELCFLFYFFYFILEWTMVVLLEELKRRIEEKRKDQAKLPGQINRPSVRSIGQ